MSTNIQSPELLDAEIKNIIKENEKLRLELAQTYEKVKLIIAKVSHEFKTPLNSIIGFTELLKQTSSEPKIIEYSDIILNCSEHMLELVRNIIDVTGAKYKPIELSYSIFNPKELIMEIIDNFKDSKINYTLINCMIYADYMRFKQLVYNLVSNALKFNKPNEEINIITYMEDSRFYFEISDKGEGIDKKNTEKIFDIFSQVTNEKDKRNLGSGIGLSLCKTIVSAHKGEIKVKSVKDKGATFIFSIPMEPDKENI